MSRFFLLIGLLFTLSACHQGPLYPRQAPIEHAPSYTLPQESVITGEGTAAGRGQVKGPKVKVGLLVPLSGDAADLGQALMDAATLALFDKYATLKNDEIHSEVVLVPKDTEGTPQGAAKAAQDAIAEGAQLLIGPVFSDAVRAVTPIAQKHNVAAITFSNNKDVAKQGIYLFGFMPEQQVNRVLQYAFEQEKQRFAALLPSNAYGHIVAEALRRMMVLHDMELKGIEFYPPSAQSIDVEIQRLLGGRNKEPQIDAILLAENGPMLEAILARLKHFGVSNKHVQLLGTGIWDDVALQSLPDAHGGWFASSPQRGYRGFAARFESQYKYSPPRLASLAYDGVALATTLAQQPGNPDYTVNSLTNADGYRGPANGIFRLRSDGICERGLAVLKIHEKDFTQVSAAPRSFLNALPLP